MDFSEYSMTKLAITVAKHLQEKKIEVVLVGGLAVEIYTENLYLTKDIDMVDTSYASSPKLKASMAEIGFTKSGKVFKNPTTDISIEFPSAPLAVGDERVTETTFVTLKDGPIRILHARDVIKDRIAAYIHWKDTQSLIQALAIMIKHDLAPTEFKTFCKREGSTKQFNMIQTCFELAKDQSANSMSELTSIVSKALRRQIS